MNGDEDAVMMAALEAGAEDVRSTGEAHEVITGSHDLFAVNDALVAAGFEVESAELVQMPSNLVPVDASTAAKVLRLVDALEDLDDVQTVYANYDVDDDVMAQLVD